LPNQEFAVLITIFAGNIFFWIIPTTGKATFFSQSDHLVALIIRKFRNFYQF